VRVSGPVVDCNAVVAFLANIHAIYNHLTYDVTSTTKQPISAVSKQRRPGTFFLAVQAVKIFGPVKF